MRPRAKVVTYRGCLTFPVPILVSVLMHRSSLRRPNWNRLGVQKASGELWSVISKEEISRLSIGLKTRGERPHGGLRIPIRLSVMTANGCTSMLMPQRGHVSMSLNELIKTESLREKIHIQVCLEECLKCSQYCQLYSLPTPVPKRRESRVDTHVGLHNAG